MSRSTQCPCGDLRLRGLRSLFGSHAVFLDTLSAGSGFALLLRSELLGDQQADTSNRNSGTGANQTDCNSMLVELHDEFLLR